jgi:hypothetical protein
MHTLARQLPILALPTACATATLAPPQDRQVVFVEDSKAPKAEAYSRAHAYFAKTFTDANHAIKSRDEAAGQIVARGNVDCNVFRQTGDTNSYVATCTLDFQAKDNRVRIAFEDLKMLGEHGSEPSWGYLQIGSKEQAEKIRSCLEPVRAGIMKAVAGTGTGNW